MKANEILAAAQGHLEDRARTYDKPAGERSMPSTVAAFNQITGHSITEEQGWIFMSLLKIVRTQQGAFRADSYEDGAAYMALAGESAEKKYDDARIHKKDQGRTTPSVAERYPGILKQGR